MRGGTSKGVLLRREDLPADPAKRDRIILRIFGSPDRRQIDGLGGADPLTSKVAILGPPSRPDADIDYLFGQVAIESASIDYGGYCGNILAGVAAYAVDEGVVKIDGVSALVRVNVANTNRIVRATVPVAGGKFEPDGDLTIAGVPGTGSLILLDFAETAGSLTGKIFPSCRPMDSIEIPGIGNIELSIVDIGNPMIFVRLSDFGVGPKEGPDQLDGRGIVGTIEVIRRGVSDKFKLLMPDGSLSNNIPLVSLVGPPATYTAYGSGQVIAAAEVDFLARQFFAGRLHKAYGIGETTCTVAAAMLQGTLVHAAAGMPRAGDRTVRFGHPSGVIGVEVEVGGTTETPVFRKIAISRTARRILDGSVYVPRNCI
jgi:2-methylaconitate cis-trans-isomerase PrpF